MNTFFTSQSTVDDTYGHIPILPDIVDQRSLEQIVISESDVLDILKTLDPTKAVGHDLVGPRLLKEAPNELSAPLCKLFNLSLNQKIFPTQWKRANVVPIFKKDDPQKVNNYRPISLLPVISKVFERCVYKYLHNFIRENQLLTQHQSGFREGDSTINQLLYLTHEFSKALDEGKEIRVVFFDISKAFDRVWHKGLLYKIEQFGIKGDLLEWIKSYLFQRKQRVVINGKESAYIEINAGVPQGSILGPLFFLIFINDIVLDIGCAIKLFADDTSIYLIIDHPNNAALELNENLEKVNNWSKQWLVKFNPRKTESLLISRKQNNPVIHPSLYFDRIPVVEVTSHKHLGLVFNNRCHWGEHIDYVVSKVSTKLNVLRSLKFDLDRKTLQCMYLSFIRPVMEYGDIIFDNSPDYCKDKLEKINIEAARIITGATKLVSLNKLYTESGFESLETRRKKHKLTEFFKIKSSMTPEYLRNLLPLQHDQQHSYPTRNSSNYILPHCRTTYHFNSFIPSTISMWNQLPNHIKESNTISSFKQKLNEYYDPHQVPRHYYVGTRKGQILHARLRMACSSLNHHLYLKNIENNPYCSCGEIETTAHFLLHCQNYHDLRIELENSLNFPITLNVLLYGDIDRDFEFNKHVCINVQKFIVNTRRFL